MTVRLLLETCDVILFSKNAKRTPEIFTTVTVINFACLKLYQVALTLARKPYRNEILFTNTNGDFDAISVKDRAKLCRAEGGPSHIG